MSCILLKTFSFKCATKFYKSTHTYTHLQKQANLRLISFISLDFILLCLIFTSRIHDSLLCSLLPCSYFNNKNIYLNNEWICCFSPYMNPRNTTRFPLFILFSVYCVILKKFASNFFFVFLLIFTFGKPNKEMNNACILLLYANDKCVLFVCLFISFIYFFFITYWGGFVQGSQLLLFFVQSTQYKGSWMDW